MGQYRWFLLLEVKSLCALAVKMVQQLSHQTKNSYKILYNTVKNCENFKVKISIINEKRNGWVPLGHSGNCENCNTDALCHVNVFIHRTTLWFKFVLMTLVFTFYYRALWKKKKKNGLTHLPELWSHGPWISACPQLSLWQFRCRIPAPLCKRRFRLWSQSLHLGHPNHYSEQRKEQWEKRGFFLKV